MHVMLSVPIPSEVSGAMILSKSFSTINDVFVESVFNSF